MAQLQKSNDVYNFRHETIPRPAHIPVTPEGHKRYNFPETKITAKRIRLPPEWWKPTPPPKMPSRVNIASPPRRNPPNHFPINHGPLKNPNNHFPTKKRMSKSIHKPVKIPKASLHITKPCIHKSTSYNLV